MTYAGAGDVDRTEFQAQLSDENKSPLEKYADICVGSRGIGSLIRYEAAFSILGPIPGALGYFLRSKLYPPMFAAAGGGLVVGVGVCIRHPRKIHLGSGVVIDDGCVLDAKGDSEEGIRIADGVILGRNTTLSCKGGSIAVGRNSNISGNCMLISESRLSIGANVLIAGMTYIVAGGNHGMERTDVPIIRQPVVQKGGVTIEDNCWLGASVTVLDGVTIGRDSVIGAGSVVTRSIPAFAIAVGVPARVVKMRKAEEEG